MITLKQNDKVAIVAPARKINMNDIVVAIEIIKSWGLQPVLADALLCEDYQYAGTDKQRTKDMQKALDNKDIKAIFCAKGGYGTIRIIDNIDFTNFNSNPKYIIGFSDITVLHCKLSNMNLKSIHAPVLTTFSKTNPQHINQLKNILFGNIQEDFFCMKNENKMNKKGYGYGKLVGGNLSILYSMLNTNTDLITDNCVLFIEDVDEYLYHIDRMMITLKRAGKLKNLRGLIVGEFNKIHDNEVPFGKDVYQIINEHVEEYDFPVIFDFPAGHGSDNMPLIFANYIELSVDDAELKIKYINGIEAEYEEKTKRNIANIIMFTAIFFILIWLMFSLVVRIV